MKAMFRIAIVALCATSMTACKTAGTAVKTDANTSATSHINSSNNTSANSPKTEAVTRITANTQSGQYVTSKIKCKIQMDDKDVSLGGKLLMKRDDVIRLQLTAFGLFEAARIEFTNDYVLVMDRVNKRYIKVDYSQVDFLKQSGLNFHSLQSLFWNELFLPGKTTRVTAADVNKYTVTNGNGTTVTLAVNNGELTYKWIADRQNGQISRFDGTYANRQGVNVGMDWLYSTFESFNAKPFPTDNTINVTTPKRTINVELHLNGIDNDCNWETRTSITSKYEQMSLDDILKKLSSL